MRLVRPEGDKLKTLNIQLNERNQIPRLFPAMKASFSLDQELGGYMLLYLVGGAAFTFLLPKICQTGETFNAPHFFLMYFIFLVFVSSIQFAIAFTHRERHFGRNATPTTSLLFVIGKLPLIILISTIRFFIDWIMVVAAIVGGAAIGGIREAKNIVAILVAVVVLIISFLVSAIADSIAAKLIRFGIPVAAYFPNDNPINLAKRATAIFGEGVNSSYRIHANAEWIFLGLFLGVIIAFPVYETIGGRLNEAFAETMAGVLISSSYLISMCFTLVYSEIVSGSKLLKDPK